MVGVGGTRVDGGVCEGREVDGTNDPLLECVGACAVAGVSVDGAEVGFCSADGAAVVGAGTDEAAWAAVVGVGAEGSEGAADGALGA